MNRKYNSTMRSRPFFRCRPFRDLLLLIVSFASVSCYLCYLLWAPPVYLSPNAGPQLPSLDNVGNALQRNILSQKKKTVNMNTSESKSSREMGKLEKLLVEIEKMTLEVLQVKQKIAIVRGQRSVIARDLPLYEKALQSTNFLVAPPIWYEGIKENVNKTICCSGRSNSNYYQESNNPSTLGWHLLLCMTFSVKDLTHCLDRKETEQLSETQKINRIPGIRGRLWKKEAFCSTIMKGKQLSATLRKQPVPLCFSLPEQRHQFQEVAHAFGTSAQWILKSVSSVEKSGPKLLDIFTLEGQQELLNSERRKAVVQQVVPNQLKVFGQPISLRLYVLVTSLSPLRAYLHSEGLVYHRYGSSRNFRKISGRLWSLSQFWYFVARNHGMQTVKLTLNNLHDVITKTLLLTDILIASSTTSRPTDELNPLRCHQCFQLMGFDVIMNGSFYPFITEINGQPNFQESRNQEGWVASRVKNVVVTDTINILFTPHSVAKDVSEALEEVGEEIGVMGLNCLISHEVCLNRQDLQILLDGRRETLNLRGFQQLYPTVEAQNQADLIHELDGALLDQKTDLSQHGTADLHDILLRLEFYYNRHLLDQEFSDDEIKRSEAWRGMNLSSLMNEPSDQQESHLQESPDIYIDQFVGRKCSNDPITMPYIGQITTSPPLTLTPSFSSLVSDYTANVSYGQLLLRVWAFGQNCQTEVRIDDKYGPSRPTNYTLGVGPNKLSFFVVDTSHTEPWVVNTYTLLVYRLPVTHDEPPFSPDFPHQVCSLKQECDLQVFSNEPCGIQKERQADWITQMKTTADLPACDVGDAPGRWVLPCGSCSNRRSCFWQEAVWNPYRCRHPLLSRDLLSQCLAKKKLLFIGDSTNRGMMHYVMERVNGTLTEWDKTHDIRVYNNLNNGQTTVSFAYYPQFWLPTNQRPVFDKTLYQLLQRSKPLKNNTDTVLIVGGVHWLATQHLHMLMRALRGERLQGIRLVMKTLGAGFHQPVDEIHSLTTTEHQKLVYHNLGLADFAKHYSFEVIDTFNVTVARYKDFLQGKCACHFHKVVEVNDSTREIRRWGNPTKKKIRYHVEGTINAIYSEILISRLCNNFVPKR
ncbi:cadherin-like and PC-esterase domain-containing protein 1 isoform X1 [Tachypleus tridentatus]|uniref:cadherin-like and PC-esterase domain-containing protein 1 isoform X1 n=2 Tax=Tachypleus tridentatus TaxID=6853 RepID=UPI003FD03990